MKKYVVLGLILSSSLFATKLELSYGIENNIAVQEGIKEKVSKLKIHSGIISIGSPISLVKTLHFDTDLFIGGEAYVGYGKYETTEGIQKKTYTVMPIYG